MGKKPKKRTPRRHVINDPTLPLLAGVELVQPQPPKPVTAARQRAWQRDRAAWLADEKARAAARRAERAVVVEERAEGAILWVTVAVWPPLRADEAERVAEGCPEGVKGTGEGVGWRGVSQF
jgi:hypothetical protein